MSRRLTTSVLALLRWDLTKLMPKTNSYDDFSSRNPLTAHFHSLTDIVQPKNQKNTKITSFLKGVHWKPRILMVFWHVRASVLSSAKPLKLVLRITFAEFHANFQPRSTPQSTQFRNTYIHSHTHCNTYILIWKGTHGAWARSNSKVVPKFRLNL